VAQHLLRDIARSAARIEFGPLSELEGGSAGAYSRGVRHDRVVVMRRAVTRENKLDLNVELAAPDEFIPVRPDWRARSVLIKSIGKVSFYHFDYYAQALAKIERGHEQDLGDVRALVNRHLVDPGRLQQEFDDLRPGLVRYPAIDPEIFAHKVRQFVASL
jgi:hypothetical protein